MPALELSDVDPIILDACLGPLLGLQVYYTSQNLAQHDNALHAEHENLPIRIEIRDFSVAGVQWEINASHPAPTGPASWTRSTAGSAYFDFDNTNGEVEVTVIAEASTGLVPPKKKVIYIKVKPKGDKPER